MTGQNRTPGRETARGRDNGGNRSSERTIRGPDGKVYRQHGIDMLVGPDGKFYLESAILGVSPTGDVAEGFNPQPLDWAELERNGIPEVRYVLEPYIPEGARVWAWGPAGSAKSLWALWVAVRLTWDSRRVVFISQENPLVEDARRLQLLFPNWDNLTFFHDADFNLTSADHIAKLIEIAQGAALVVLDTLSAVWGGDEDSNRAIADFDRLVLKPLVRETGAAVLLLDHTGHPQAFVRRGGVLAGRGASSKGQKADSVIEFKSEGPRRFRLIHDKPRIGGIQAPEMLFEIIGGEDGGDGIEIVPVSSDQEDEALASALVEVIREREPLKSRELREAARALKAGTERTSRVIALLEAERPPRVERREERVATASGATRAKVWRVSRGYPEPVPDKLGEAPKGIPHQPPYMGAGYRDTLRDEVVESAAQRLKVVLGAEVVNAS